jgi:polyhydroxyalkanoate synthesis regulator phasin
MEQKPSSSMNTLSFTDTCMKSASLFFESVVRQMNPGEVGEKDKKETNEMDPEASETMAFILKNWGGISKGNGLSETVAAFFNDKDLMPDALLQLNQSVMENTIAVQQDILQSVGRISDATNGYDFKEADGGLFQLWQTIYDKELSRFYQIPQLGMMRTYQEKIGRMLDKYNRFQSNLSEFTRLLARPFKKSQKVVAEVLKGCSAGEDASEKTQKCYQKWVKVLEENFMSLFQSPEYITTLSMTMSALADFIAVRDDAIEDLLKFFPVARKSDMDDMARELYDLKKRLRKLEMASALKISS